MLFCIHIETYAAAGKPRLPRAMVMEIKVEFDQRRIQTRCVECNGAKKVSDMRATMGLFPLRSRPEVAFANFGEPKNLLSSCVCLQALYSSMEEIRISSGQLLRRLPRSVSRGIGDYPPLFIAVFI